MGKADQSWPGQTRAEVGRHRPRSAKYKQSSAQITPSLADIVSSLVRVWRSVVDEIGQPDYLWSNSGETWPEFGACRQKLEKMPEIGQAAGQIRREWAVIGVPEAAATGAPGLVSPSGSTG